jgi:hypothetical protein
MSLMKSKHLGQLVVLLLLAILASLVVAESLWWNNVRQTYPHWLVSPTPANANDLVSLRQVCGDPLEVKDGDANMIFVRCGAFWPMRSVWLVPKIQVAPALE